MRIEEHYSNDGKEKRQSQSLKIEMSISDVDLDAYGDLNVIFYGKDKEEVINNKKLFINKLIETLNNLKEEI